MANVHQQELLTHVVKLMNDPRDCDFKIVCGDREWLVHKAIISQSPTLAHSCHGPWKEAQDGVYPITLFEPDTVGYAINYLYSRTYVVESGAKADIEDADDESSGNENTNVNDNLVAHAHVFGIGGYLELDSLKTLSVEKFAAVAAKRGWQAEGFIEVVKAVDGRSGPDDRRLRDAFRQYAMNHCNEIVQDSSIMMELAELEQAEDFAVDMFQNMVQRQIEEKAQHDEALKQRDDELERQNQRIIELQAETLRLEQDLSDKDAQHKDKIDHVKGVMQQLVRDLQSLPAQCPNQRCGQEFGNLALERTRHPVYGPGEGNWEIRCGTRKCRAALK